MAGELTERERERPVVRTGDPGGEPFCSPEAAAIHVEGLRKTFGSGDEAVEAVRDVSFSVEPGSVVGLLGPNGAGKTTTVKSILGLVIPEAGTVHVDGVNVYEKPRKAFRRVDAMLEGARNDYWRLTVRENLRYFATIGGDKPAAIADRHEELLERLDLAEKADTAVRDLSRGQKQKVSLASALASDVSVVFLDEPTLGLDVESSLTLRRELARIVEERNLTVVLSSHDMDVIEDLCDRVLIMNDGEVIVDDTVGNLLDGFETQGYRITARNLDDRTLSALRERFDVTGHETLGERHRIEVAVHGDEFYRLVDLLERHEVDLAGVETVQPDLAEAFVELTSAGRGDDGDEPGGEVQ